MAGSVTCLPGAAGRGSPRGQGFLAAWHTSRASVPRSVPRDSGAETVSFYGTPSQHPLCSAPVAVRVPGEGQETSPLAGRGQMTAFRRCSLPQFSFVSVSAGWKFFLRIHSEGLTAWGSCLRGAEASSAGDRVNTHGTGTSSGLRPPLPCPHLLALGCRAQSPGHGLRAFFALSGTGQWPPLQQSRARDRQQEHSSLGH